MTQSTALAVHRSLVVEASATRAFETFVTLSAWWPLESHTTGVAPARASIVEPRAGGRWYEIDATGAELEIGRVLAYEPPERIVLAWLSNCNVDGPAPVATEVEVRFTPESVTRTRLDLEHRGFEAYGEQASENRDRYESGGAWTFVLSRFSAYFS